MTSNCIFLPLCFCLRVAVSGHAEDQAVNAKSLRLLTFQSSEQQTALVELFTSEGCSSCPPAEKWLSGLKQSPGLWKEFVPVAFHVDYWDYLGWRDRWGSKGFSDRQRAYAEWWRTDSIYTPGLVLNGSEWRTWARENGGPRSSGKRAGVLKVSSSDLKHWQVTFSPTAPVDGGCDAFAVLLANDLNSDVKAGENRGQRLHHDFVVTGVAKNTLALNGGRFAGELNLDLTGSRITNPAVAIWVTRAGQMSPIQSIGGWVSAP